MQKVKKIIAGLVMIAIGSFIIYMLLADGLGKYNVLKMEVTEATIIMKYSEKGTFTPPEYYVSVEKLDGDFSSNHAISKKQINSLDSGDTLSGYKAMDDDFLTQRDIRTAMIILIVVLLICLALIVTGILVIYSQFFTFRGKHFFKKYVKKRYIFIPITVIVLFYVGQFSVNMFHTLIPVNQKEAVAEVLSKDTHTYRGRRTTSTSYTLNVAFPTQSDEKIHVHKKVPKKTYDHYEEGETLSISYREVNPYDIFMLDDDAFTWKNLFYFSPNMLYLYVILFVFIGVFGTSIIKKFLKRRR